LGQPDREYGIEEFGSIQGLPRHLEYEGSRLTYAAPRTTSDLPKGILEDVVVVPTDPNFLPFAFSLTLLLSFFAGFLRLSNAPCICTVASHTGYISTRQHYDSLLRPTLVILKIAFKDEEHSARSVCSSSHPVFQWLACGSGYAFNTAV